MPPFTPLFINGQHVPAKLGATFEIRNPYNNDLVGSSASATSEDGTAAVEAAASAFLTWSQTTLADRRAILLKAALLWQSDTYKQKVIQCMREETAATVHWAMSNWASSARLLETHEDALDKLKGRFFPSSVVPAAQVLVQRRAMGVIFSIAPWNAPITLAFRAVIAPLLAGNTLVLKSSEYSPRSQAIIVELLHEAGLPAGVLNYVSCSRENAAVVTADIIAHPLVRKITFTGSDRVGRIIATQAAKHLKPCIFELGGKAPTIVLNDANINEAAKAIAYSALAFSGQVCMSTERVIAQRNIAEALLERLHALFEHIKASDPADPTVGFSALFSEASAENVLGLIRDAQEVGARVHTGPVQRERSLVQPHIVLDVKPSMKLRQRESFGPVITFTTIDTVDEAIDLANETDYSLTAALWTAD